MILAAHVACVRALNWKGWCCVGVLFVVVFFGLRWWNAPGPVEVQRYSEISTRRVK